MFKRLSYFVAALLAAWIVFGVHPSDAAGTIYQVRITGASFAQCGSIVLEGSYVPAAYDSSGAPIASFNAIAYFTTNNGGAAPQNVSLTTGANSAFYLAIGPDPMEFVEVYIVSADNPALRSETVRFNCDGSIEFLGGAVNADGEISADDRLNWAQGDLINVLYARRDRAGRPGVNVYRVVDSDKGVLVGRFGFDLIQPYIDNPPAENTFIARIDQSELYVLSTGELQIVIIDPDEVKQYSIIFTLLPTPRVYFR